MVKLVYKDQFGSDQSVELNEYKNVIRIGRNPDCDISVPHESSVSRVHALVSWRDGRLFVQDPPNGHPTNGIKVDTMRLKESEVIELLVGSELICGKFVLHVVGDDDENQEMAHMGDQLGSASPNMYQPQAYPQQMVQPPQMPQAYPQQAYLQQPQQSPQPPQAQAQAQSPYGQPNYAARGYTPTNNRGFAAQKRAVMPPTQMNNPIISQNAANALSNTGSNPVVDAGRRNTRSNYVPTHLATNASSPQPMAQNANMGISLEEFNALKEENAKLKRELEENKVNTSSQEDEVQRLQAKLDERDQIMADYERRIENNDTIMTSLTDKIEKLKEQLEHQSDQIQNSRRELEISRDEAESLKMELENLHATLESNDAEASNAQSANANLKVELQKKIRMLDELQRELDLAQYSYKEERDNVECLKENIDMLNASLETAERQNKDMKVLIDQHDVMFDELKGKLSDRERDVKQLQDALRGKGGGDSAALMQEISKLRDELTHKTSEIELLQKQLSRAENQDDNARENVDQLKSRIQELESMLAEKSDSTSNGDLSKAQDCYQELNDAVCMCRDDISTLDSSISELQRVFVAYVKIDINHLQGQERTRLENALKSHDPKMIFEDIGNALYSSQNNMKSIKETLKTMRNALQM